jgi:hypothetical protein
METIKDLLVKRLNKAEGIILAKWYFEKTGEDHMNCMCTHMQRKQIQNKVNKYIKDNDQTTDR